MARLPQPGSDSGTWGDILNDYLSQTHNPDGTLRSDVVSSSNISDGSIDAAKLAESYVQSSEKGSPNGVATLDGSGKVPTSQLPPGTDPVMGGDLTGTASNAQIANGAINDADINASAAIAQSKIANLTADLTGKAAASHAHAIADVTNLQTSLDAKADEAITISGGTSLTGGGDLTANRTLTLVNDAATPGNSRYYGTDGAGTKGFHTLPSQDPALGGDLTGTASNAQISTGAIVDADINASAAIAQSKVANLTSDLASRQIADADLTAIAALSPANDDLLQRKAGAWTNRTPAQVKTDLSLTKTDVGLSNVDNTSDTNKPVSTATQTALNGKANTSHTHVISDTTGLQTALDAKTDETITVSGGTSLTGGGDLTANRTISLVNDAATPGNSRYYGTDGAGTKGFHAIPASDPTMGGDLTGTASNAQIATGSIVNADINASAAIAQSKVANLTSDLAGKSDVGHTHAAATISYAGSTNLSATNVEDALDELDAEKIGNTDSRLMPSGSITQFAGSATPAGWLICDGAAVSRATYSALFAIVGTTYGAGDGSTTFNVPNLKGRVPVGLDSAQTEFDALGETGGAKTHTLTSAEMPSHTHVQNSHNHTQDAHGHGSTGVAGNHTHGHHVGWSEDVGTHDWAFNNGADVSFMRHGNWTTNAAGDHSHTISSATATNQAATATNQNTGGGGAHNNLQPYITLNYIIKY